MNRNSIYLIILFTFIWIILSESISLWPAAAGLVVSIVCVYFSGKLLAVEKISNVSFWRLFIYIFYLAGQIYLAGFAAIILIIKGARSDIVKVDTKLESDFLKVILANSITLTPGTLVLELKGDIITVLWLRDKKSDPHDLENAGEQIKGKLEKQLLKAQK